MSGLWDLCEDYGAFEGNVSRKFNDELNFASKIVGKMQKIDSKKH